MCVCFTYTLVHMSHFASHLPAVLGGSLRSKTVCATAQQKQSVHYNLHSLYGLMEAKASARSGQDHSNTHTRAHRVDNCLLTSRTYPLNFPSLIRLVQRSAEDRS